MSLLIHNFESKYLNSNQEVSILLPDCKREFSPSGFYRNGKKYKVLWLLHGTCGDHTDWIRKTNIELYAAKRNLIVVMPSALNSNYSNWNDSMLGYRMYDYLTEELMPLIYGWFPASDRREDNFIAGLSMGGRGAIKYAVNHPELFAAAAVLSAVPVDFRRLRPGHENPLLNTEDPRLARSIANAGGLESYIHSEENVWEILTQKSASGSLPRLMFACGEDDKILYNNYLLFQAHCTKIGLDVKWFCRPGFGHEWPFWDLSIQEALSFFGLNETDGGNPF